MEMELSELSKKDTAEERCKLFVRDAVTSTMKEIKDIINASLDKDKANVVNMSPVTSIAAAAGAVGGIPGAKTGANILKKGAENQLRINNHKRAKKLHKLFEGFNENFQNWRTMLIEAYFEFFKNGNLQFFHLLKDLEDSWENAMKKVAEDAKCRLFNYLEVIVDNNHGKEQGHEQGAYQ